MTTDPGDHDVQGVRSGVVVSGRPGRTRVVLVHGALDRSTGMARLARRLGDEAEVLRYDRRGYGRAVGHPGPFTIDAHVDDLIGILHHRGGRPAVLVGHSVGAHVALRAAECAPRLVLGVAVYEPPMSWAPWWVSSRREPASNPDDAAEAFMRRMVGDRVWERLPPATRASRRAEGRAFVAEGTDLRRGPPWNASGIVCEVVMGHGDSSPSHFVRASRELAGSLGAEVVVVPGADHGAHLTSTTSLAERLVRPLVTRCGHSPGMSTS